MTLLVAYNTHAMYTQPTTLRLAPQTDIRHSLYSGLYMIPCAKIYDSGRFLIGFAHQRKVLVLLLQAKRVDIWLHLESLDIPPSRPTMQ
jgi:hypothetical protein